MLDQYETVLRVLRKVPVKRQTDEYDVARLMPLAREAWDSFAWESWDPEEPVPPAPASYGEERPLSPDELEAFMQTPIVIHPIPLRDYELRVLVMKAIRPEKRRDSIRSRLAYALLAERWNSSPGIIRSRIQAARKLEKELNPT